MDFIESELFQCKCFFFNPPFSGWKGSNFVTYSISTVITVDVQCGCSVPSSGSLFFKWRSALPLSLFSWYQRMHTLFLYVVVSSLPRRYTPYKCSSVLPSVYIKQSYPCSHDPLERNHMGSGFFRVSAVVFARLNIFCLVVLRATKIMPKIPIHNIYTYCYMFNAHEAGYLIPNPYTDCYMLNAQEAGYLISIPTLIC